jgi:hypothetical protein
MNARKLMEGEDAKRVKADTYNAVSGALQSIIARGDAEMAGRDAAHDTPGRDAGQGQPDTAAIDQETSVTEEGF